MIEYLTSNYVIINDGKKKLERNAKQQYYNVTLCNPGKFSFSEYLEKNEFFYP